MRMEISYGRLMMMGDEERAEYLASQMTIDSNDTIQVGDIFMDSIIPPGVQIDLLRQWDEFSQAMGMPTTTNDFAQDDLVTVEAYRIRNQRSAGDLLLEQLDFTEPLPKKECDARICRERKPVPVLDHVAFGNEGFIDDIRYAYAESVGVAAHEVNIGIE